MASRRGHELPQSGRSHARYGLGLQCRLDDRHSTQLYRQTGAQQLLLDHREVVAGVGEYAGHRCPLLRVAVDSLPYKMIVRHGYGRYDRAQPFGIYRVEFVGWRRRVAPGEGHVTLEELVVYHFRMECFPVRRYRVYLARCACHAHGLGFGRRHRFGRLFRLGLGRRLRCQRLRDGGLLRCRLRPALFAAFVGVGRRRMPKHCRGHKQQGEQCAGCLRCGHGSV